MNAAVKMIGKVAAYTDDPRLAPAFFVSFYEGFVSNPDTGFQRGAAPIVALMVFGLVMLSLPLKMYFRWVFNLKYIISIPEWFFNI